MDSEERIRRAERMAFAAVYLAVLSAQATYRKPRKKSLGDRLWDLI